jgi:exodeoxyribonuclease III
VKIASWNINSLRKRQERLFDWLAKEQPDVVCLQETKCSDDQFPELALSAAGYNSVFHGQKSYNGVAILSRHELHDREAALCTAGEDPQARVIAATVHDVRVICIYAPNGQAVGSSAFQYKLRWFAELRDCIAYEQNILRNVLVCGDFNVAPEDRDVHDPVLWRGAIMCSENERAAFRALEQVGFRDTLRLHHADTGLFSWWDYRMMAFQKNRGLRIDEILASDSLAKRCTATGIDREMRNGKDPSDHAPVWAEFSTPFSS